MQDRPSSHFCCLAAAGDEDYACFNPLRDIVAPPLSAKGWLKANKVYNQVGRRVGAREGKEPVCSASTPG
jgi:hypothetical protein